MRTWYLGFGLLLLAPFLLGGCARTAINTTGFALESSDTLNAPFEAAWNTTKSVLRERGLEIYTRDKRGTFVVFTKQSRLLGVLTPRRTKITIELAPESGEKTHVYLQTIRQIYGVTPLTYPDWHDRKATSDAEAKALLEAIKAKLTEAPAK